MKKFRFGIISTANIGLNHVIPAMHKSSTIEVAAISSRNLVAAQQAATRLAIPTAYGSYEELLADPTLDAIYNPLPNHLHAEWSAKAADAGRHVLCEKPLAMNSKEAQELHDYFAAKGLLLNEAFMYRTHPRWKKVKQLVDDGAIGELVSIHSTFCYFNDDPDNIRSVWAKGGGALMDIGCYPISAARYLTGSEPEIVGAALRNAPGSEVDTAGAGTLAFGDVLATFLISTRASNEQRVHISGSMGRIDIEMPYNPPVDEPTHIAITTRAGQEVIAIPTTDQYQMQGEAFARAVTEGEPTTMSAADTVGNMRVIEQVFEFAGADRLPQVWFSR